MARARPAAGTEPARPAPETTEPTVSSVATPPAILPRLADLGLLITFLGLAFLLGCFPLRDTDFWWHLRTGDLIRQGAGFPVEDWYTFGAAGHAWIDLHWLFEILISLGYEAWGVVGLNLAKCVITCLALGLLITSRRRDWPIWLMILVWLPALFLLGGRMYVRPETLTLLYMAGFLAILTRWETWPKLAYLLPVIQVLWVNTQGLFIFGPFFVVCALLDAAVRPGAFAVDRRAWWRTIGIAGAATMLACVVNPYGLLGALFPIQLLRTMGDPIFSRTIGELMPVISLSPAEDFSFVAEMGFRNLPLQLQFATMILGAWSFVVPILWEGTVRLRSAAPPDESPPSNAKKKKRKVKSKQEDAPVPADSSTHWRLSLFRLLLFAAFSLLSLKATRNSHQFAAVVGAVTAWNFGEWAAVRRHRRNQRRPERVERWARPRWLTLAVLLACFWAVGTGRFYAWAGEGRTIGLGEEPFWFPHEAVRFAGSNGMPDRFVCFHNGHAALYEYAHGPDRKVFADARLEVMGPEVYRRYIELERRIQADQPGWEDELAAMGRPGILVDNVQTGSAGLAATLMTKPAWTLVWFDPVASVFVPAGTLPAKRPTNFAARHFEASAQEDARSFDALLASARALHDVAFALGGRGRLDLARPMILLGFEEARRARAIDPQALRPWKLMGLLEATRDMVGSPDEPVARFRMPFDPVFDLGPSRATYLLEQARERAPDDGKVLFALALLFQGRGMYEVSLPIETKLAELDPPHQRRSATRMAQQTAIALAARSTAELGRPLPTTWRNLGELESLVDSNLRTGRIVSAIELLERAYPPAARSWEIADRIATLNVHLGRPEAARVAWRAAMAEAPRPALVRARIAATHWMESEYDEARAAYREALEHDPALFEALYGLALVERDAGRAGEALAWANRALEVAPNAVATKAAREIVDLASPFADGPITSEASGRETPPGGPSTEARR